MTSASNARVQKLLDLGQSLVTNPKWIPHDGKTFCNMAVCSAAVSFNYDGFLDKDANPILADDMIRKMASDPKHWKPSTAQDAWDNALLGGLSIASYSAAPDGHVAVVAPGARVWSAKWSCYNPPVFNVGKDMNLKAPYTMGANFAFFFRPNYYVLIA